MDRYFGQKWWYTVKIGLKKIHYKMLIDGLEYDYLWIIVIFGLSFWRYPFTAEDSFSANFLFL